MNATELNYMLPIYTNIKKNEITCFFICYHKKQNASSSEQLMTYL